MIKEKEVIIDKFSFIPAVAKAGAEEAGQRRGELVWAASSSRRRQWEGFTAAGDLPDPAPAAAGSPPCGRRLRWAAALLSSIRVAAQVGGGAALLRAGGGSGGRRRRHWGQGRCSWAAVAQVGGSAGAPFSREGGWGWVSAVAGAVCFLRREEGGGAN